jgi:hypothetical protein
MTAEGLDCLIRRVWTCEKSECCSRRRNLERIWICEIVMSPLPLRFSAHDFSAFPQDAITAVEKFQGKDLAGRKLILEIAVFSGQTTKAEKDALSSHRPADAPVVASKIESERVTEAAAVPSSASASLSGPGPSPSLQVVVCGVPSHLNKKAFKEIVQGVHRCPKLVVELLKEVTLPPTCPSVSYPSQGPSTLPSDTGSGCPPGACHAPHHSSQTRCRHSRLKT